MFNDCFSVAAGVGCCESDPVPARAVDVPGNRSGATGVDVLREYLRIVSQPGGAVHRVLHAAGDCAAVLRQLVAATEWMIMEGRSPRGQVGLVDIIIGLTVLIPILVLAPVIWRFIDMIVPRADPFTQLLLSLSIPFLLMAFIVSMGVSARSGGL